MNRRILSGLILTTLLACSGKSDEDDDDTGSGGGLVDDSGGTPQLDCDDAEIPCIEALEAYCYSSTTGSVATYWRVEASVDDPQGSDTVEEGAIIATKGENIVHEARLICTEGDCFGSWNIVTADSPMSCNDDEYTFTVTVTDEDGNTSAPSSTVGYVGADQ